MTLAQWARGNGATVHTHGNAVWVVDDRRIEHARTQLWDLTDYVVSSVSGGSVWLVPRA
jgi:hypothetical protein